MGTHRETEPADSNTSDRRITTTELDAQQVLLDSTTGQLIKVSSELTRVITKGTCIPAPNAYITLGNLKVALWELRNAIAALRNQLEASHQHNQLDITDRDPVTEENRDPKESLRLAVTELRTIGRHLAEVTGAADLAQEALSGQQYTIA